MVTKEPKSEKTTGRASTKKAVTAQPESTLVESENTVTKAKGKGTAAKAEATAKAAATEGATTAITSPLSQDEVAQRAYILWLERGCPHGDSAQDWFTAIRQLETAK